VTVSRKKKGVAAGLVSTESTLKKLQTQFIDPRFHYWLGSGGFAGVRKRLLTIDFPVLRSAVDKLPLVNAIINTRVDQIQPFLEYTDNENEKGYVIEPVDGEAEEDKDKKKQKAHVRALREFIEQTGFKYDPDREDDFQDYVQMLVRETYVIDQIATELQRNRMGQVLAFWAVDGATIRRVEKESDFASGVRFVQQIDEQIYAKYTYDQIVFDYKYKRADIRYRGFGYSPVEQAIDVITTLLFGYNYIRDQMVKDKMPRGFISVMGDVGKPQLDSIRNYWYSAMSGMGGQWNIPILPSGKDGVGMDFKVLSNTNKEMEFHKTIMFVTTMIGAVFGIDVAEMGIKTDDSSAIIGESSYNRTQISRERGLRSMLMYLQQHINKIVRKISPDYRLKFCGVEPEDLDKKSQIRQREVATHKSVDELREEDGLEPFNEEWSKIPANPTIIQLYMSLKQEEQMQQQQQQQQAMGGQPGMPGAEGQMQPGMQPGAEQGQPGAPGAGGENPDQFTMGGQQGPMFGKARRDRLDLLKARLRLEGDRREKVVHFVVE
jgi:hypothetical protein